MKNQRKVLSDAVKFIRSSVPNCSIFLTGSVRYGYERDDSDVDLGVLVPDISSVNLTGGTITDETKEVKSININLNGVHLDIVFVAHSFQDRFSEKPWRGYKFMEAEILHDPKGTIKSYQDNISAWFKNNPKIADVWKEWMKQRKEYVVSGGKTSGDLIKNYGDSTKFWDYLDKLVEEKAGA